jgi:hypothetical protein
VASEPLQKLVARYDPEVFDATRGAGRLATTGDGAADAVVDGVATSRRRTGADAVLTADPETWRRSPRTAWRDGRLQPRPALGATTSTSAWASGGRQRRCDAGAAGLRAAGLSCLQAGSEAVVMLTGWRDKARSCPRRPADALTPRSTSGARTRTNRWGAPYDARCCRVGDQVPGRAEDRPGARGGQQPGRPVAPSRAAPRPRSPLALLPSLAWRRDRVGPALRIVPPTGLPSRAAADRGGRRAPPDPRRAGRPAPPAWTISCT